MEIVATTDARKERLEAEAVWQLLGEANQVLVAKGKKVLTFSPQQDDKAEILSQVMGRSGNLRAPTLRIRDKFVVGYSEALYAEVGL